MRYLAAVPHITITDANGTYFTLIGALLAIVAVIWWKGCPKWLAVVVTLLATAAALSTPGFGPWLQTYLHGVTNGILGR